MADTNTYISKQKVEKWTTKEKFNALELSTIEPGTEYNLTGAIEEGELDSALQTKINSKLTKPTNPTAESAVTMLSDGTVGTKLLSEIGGGGKLYEHNISVRITNNEYNKTIYITLYNNDGSKITVAKDIPLHSIGQLSAQPVSPSNMPYFSLVMIGTRLPDPSPDNPTPKAIITVYGVGTDVAGTAAKPIFETYSEYTMGDTVTEL